MTPEYFLLFEDRANFYPYPYSYFSVQENKMSTDEEYNWSLAENFDLDLDDDDDAFIDFQLEVGDKVMVSNELSVIESGNELVQIPGIEEEDGPVMICPIPTVTVKLHEGLIDEWQFIALMQVMSDAAENPIFNLAQPGLDASHTASHVKAVQETNGLDLKNYADYLFDTMSKFVGDSATCKKDIVYDLFFYFCEKLSCLTWKRRVGELPFFMVLLSKKIFMLSLRDEMPIEMTSQLA